MNKNVIELTDANFAAQVLQAKLPVLVDFWATWCGPCKQLGPQVAAVAERFAGKLIVGKLDIDLNEEISKQYRIASVPSLLLFRDGKVVWTQVGVPAKGKVEATIAELLAAG